MESIDCALELGYDPVKVNFSLCTDLLFNHISTGCSEKIQKRGMGGWQDACLQNRPFTENSLKIMKDFTERERGQSPLITP